MKKLVKKFHLYLGILFTLPLIILATTGIMISYFNDYSYLIDKAYYGEIKSEAKSINEILADLKSKKPEFSLSRINLGDCFVSFRGKENGKNKTYFYAKDGKFLDEKVASNEVLKFIHDMHFNLGLKRLGYEKLGTWITGIAGICVLLFVISGIWLYFGDLRRNFKRAVSLNFGFANLAKWRNFHSAIGLYIALIISIIGISSTYYAFSLVKDYIAKLDSGSKNFKTKREFLDIDADLALANFKGIGNNSRLYIYGKDDYMLRVGSLNEYDIYKEVNASNFSVRESKKDLKRLAYSLHTGFFNRFTQIIWVLSCLGLLAVIFFGFKALFARAKRS